MINRLYHVNAKVFCEYSQQITNMPMSYTYLDNKVFYFPCNGCDNYASSKFCDKCILFVTNLFALTPEYDLSKPIYPMSKK